MPDRTRPDSRPDGDRTTIAEAAARLDISTDAVRKRLTRGHLAGEKVGGVWVVFLDVSESDRTESSSGPDSDRTETGPDRTLSSDLIAAKDETIAILREELNARTNELQAAHVIISQLTQRLPQLGTGRESPQDRDVAPHDATPPVEGQQSSRRRWWRFWG